MGAIVETWRGSSAMARWLATAPLMARQVTRMATTTEQAKQIIMAHSERMLKTCKIDVEISGRAPKPGEGCVVCYNETSLADVVTFAARMLPHLDRAAAADLYGWIPFARAACEIADIEMVPRGNRAGTEKLMEKVVAAVRGGDRLAWGGEGRLSGRDGVRRFKRGASLIAIRAGVPLVPVACYGGHRALPLGSFRARPGKISIRFGDPMDTTGLGEDDARDFTDRVQAVVVGLYETLKSERAAAI